MKPSGQIGDACCSFETIESLNVKLLPQLTDIVHSTFFKYYKVNLQKGCPFWPENMMCVQRDCAVEEVEDKNEIPDEWKTNSLSNVDFSNLDNGFVPFKKQCSDKDFCLPEDESSSEGVYVNLNKNPERFTGYTGESANRIWASIYKENCFNLVQNTPHKDFRQFLEEDTCKEKRVFYKLISGLHSSISTHICYEYLDQKTGIWYADLECFLNRVGQFPDRVQNMYFTYAVVLRAVKKLSPYLQSYNFCTGNSEETNRIEIVCELVKSVVTTSTSCPQTFDEHLMFTSPDSNGLMEQFKSSFRNISRIMDCVGCEKCRLWGKVQITGLGTALKVLFSYSDNTIDYRLTRNEIVALFNGFFRLSESLHAVNVFREMHKKLNHVSVNNTIKTPSTKSPQDIKLVENVKEPKTNNLQTPIGESQKDTNPKTTTPNDSTVELPFDLSNTWLSDPRNVWTFGLGALIMVFGFYRIIVKGWQMEKGSMEIPDRIDKSRKERGEKLSSENGNQESKKKSKSKRR
ncbi:hypothetical protein HK096_008138 [Nowakowskiella sp. JEL0078]|nr:hypothetical protein HK096_008138 [Nowakowskiella sp. JEL0078]